MINFKNEFLREHFNNLERKISLRRFPDSSVFLIILIKLRVIAQFLVESILILPKNRPALKVTKHLIRRENNPMALVLGNGPSLNKLKPESIASAQNEGMDVFAVNYYALSNFGRILIPNYYILSDPDTSPTSKGKKNEKLWKILLDDYKSTKIVIPTSWYKKYDVLRGESDRTFYFDDRSLETFSKNISPLKPRGYASMTAYKALALACAFRYKQIGIIGVDNSMFLNVKSNELNNILEIDSHFYDNENEKSVSNLDQFYPNGMTDYLFDHARLFSDLRKCFKDSRIINLDDNSLVDAFTKSKKLGKFTFE